MRPNAAVERHRIEVQGQAVEYALRRSPRRRSLALSVDDAGVHVAVPAGTSLREVERFINHHAGWLQDKLRVRAERGPAEVFVLRDGATLPVLGGECRVRLGPGARAVWRTDREGGEELWLPGDARAGVVLERALRARALAWFRGRVEEYCYRLGLTPPPVRLSSARTRWGSCSSRSGIRLHWRLVHLAPALVDYVVAHEVAHLLEMNHSPRFWAVVERIYPAWQEARRALRRAGASLPRLPGAANPTDNEED